ncbi:MULTISPECIES: CmpA/NrtA family ABC transporter substrate-binding protein [unclassified Caballeronia]|uniref:CmpA/NrtA family ABC transporter substrate-binding protein n=1 Tax=unclassified Caballeronia TaxID=2646786 RepID=UPI0028668E73|nr:MULTISPECIES: CmpA/NrtA family ABC transporter substrate-binding protein [unclassified Caballeronia]MDR5739698.1 CmpA/NrtA family ABC transporter substrate-binding protein [Caballeronia sp. LZ016]MDR5808164.1 CmpA/NrtA family ABC transporter substrate-binding protein [Caballeronia sp. LZ019]
MNASDNLTPERSHLRLGFVALSDAAPLAAAALRDMGRRHGIRIELCRQPSWAAVRDKLLSGELDAAHALYGLVYGVQLGIGGPQADMAVLMVLNRNGQAITLSNPLADAIQRGASVKDALASLGRTPVLAQTFPTGTHAMWLYYWLATQRVHPLVDVRSVVIPPPRMADALVEGTLDGFCAGDPWHAVAEARGAGRTVVYTGEIWPDHPEKVLACRRDFVALYPNTARALVRTMLDACEWLDAREHRPEIADALAASDLLGVPRELIASRLGAIEGVAPLRFFDGGAVNYPRASDGLWFITQYRRWGMLAGDGDDTAVAAAVNQTALYAQAAQEAGVALPAATRKSTFCDGRVWDGSAAKAYLSGFDMHA